ncbi:hypothetical protein BMS3Bbin11_01586 [bacterium BMS3Bbin11]|nr:hypothetical protein BMS3Bbin11_01586 [bacterium BMS3Bbin11]
MQAVPLCGQANELKEYKYDEIWMGVAADLHGSSGGWVVCVLEV